MIYCRNELTSGDWNNIPGGLKYISVSNGNLYGVNSLDNVYAKY